jgi:hypothetical protein
VLTLFRRMFTRTFEALGGGVVGAVALGLLLGAGVAVACWPAIRDRGASSSRDSLPARARGPAAPVIALLAGSVVFAGSVAQSRAALSLYPAGRYLHVLAAMLLPTLVLAGTELVRRQRLALPLVVLVLAAGVPSNVDKLSPGSEAAFTLGSSREILTIAKVADEVHAPPGLRLLPGLVDPLTAGFLADGVRTGRIPVPDEVDPATVQRARLTLALEPLAEPVASSGPTCRPVGAGPVPLEAGQVLVGRGGPFTVAEPAGGASASVGYYPVPDPDHRDAPLEMDLRVVRPMVVRLLHGGTVTVRVCG